MAGKDVVVSFLTAMEARDLDEAKKLLAPDAVMTFPSGKRFTALEDLVAWSRGRYKFVRKTYEAFEEVTRDGVTTVYCRGVLNGEWPAAPESNVCMADMVFNNVRFIDRFDIKDGLIIDQQVWNDLAEIRP